MANLIYVHPQSALTFLASGGTVLFTPTSTADQNGRVSQQLDRGASARAAWYEWRAWTKAASAPTAGLSIGVFLSTSDGTIQDGNLGTSDANITNTSSLAANKRQNLRQIGNMFADGDASIAFNASGFVYVPSRYISVYWFNSLGVALSPTATDHGFSLTPVPDELQ